MIRQLFRSSNLTHKLKSGKYQPTYSKALHADARDQDSPADFYKYIYSYDVHPEMRERFNYYSHDPHMSTHWFQWDNYRFSYQGEWWDRGGHVIGRLYFLLPFIMYAYHCYYAVSSL